MDPKTRYKVKAPTADIYRSAETLLRQRAEVLVCNARRRSIAATRIDADLADELRALHADLVEDVQYDSD